MSAAAVMPDLVSVIMPFYNTRESFLQDAIQSIRSQSYKHWELILIDDGSVPSASECALRIVSEDPDRIRYVDHEQHQNLGISASRNRGLSMACGEFIAFLDADDVWDREQLEEQVELLRQNAAAALLYGNTLYWTSWEQGSEQNTADVLYKTGLRSPQLLQPPKLLRMILQRRTFSPCMTSVIARRQLFFDGITFENAFREHYEDQVFLAKVFTNYPVYVADRCWGKYRQHSESVTADGDDSARALDWRLKYLCWLSDYLIACDQRGTPVWYALRMELWMSQNRYAEKAVSILRKIHRKIRRAFGALDAA